MRSRFQILSDIHLEKKKYDNKILEHPIKARNLILAGDIGNPLKSNYKEYLKFCSAEYHNVFIISGNHEYWKNTIEGTNKLITDICSTFKNVHYLNNRFIDLEENNRKIRLFGGIMWSYVNDKNQYSMDNLLINGFDFNQRNTIFVDTLKMIKSKESDIIITHHSPSFQLVHSKYVGLKNNCLFATNLEYLLDDKKYWICGHLHEYNKTPFNKLIINCCHDGYQEKIIELD
jgi:predicted phosphohydrolase